MSASFAAMKRNLHTALKYAGNCHHGYIAAEPPARRLYKQAFFERIKISEYQAIGMLSEPFDAIRAVVSTITADITLPKRARTARVTRRANPRTMTRV